jgi:unsaturated rhamnogalacturonyl hydrolase
MSLVDVAELVGPEAFSPLRPRTSDLLQRIADLRGPSGLWLQVIDAPELEGNYVETSASAMFTYALLRSETLGLSGRLEDDLVTMLTANAMQTAADGHMHMEGICEVAGLGGFEGRYRDGTPGYYLREPVVRDDAKGVGPLMMCAAVTMMNQSEAAFENAD